MVCSAAQPKHRIREGRNSGRRWAHIVKHNVHCGRLATCTVCLVILMLAAPTSLLAKDANAHKAAGEPTSPAPPKPRPLWIREGVTCMASASNHDGSGHGLTGECLPLRALLSRVEQAGRCSVAVSGVALHRTTGGCAASMHVCDEMAPARLISVPDGVISVVYTICDPHAATDTTNPNEEQRPVLLGADSVDVGGGGSVATLPGLGAGAGAGVSTGAAANAGNARGADSQEAGEGLGGVALGSVSVSAHVAGTITDGPDSTPTSTTPLGDGRGGGGGRFQAGVAATDSLLKPKYEQLNGGAGVARVRLGQAKGMSGHGEVGSRDGGDGGMSGSRGRVSGGCSVGHLEDGYESFEMTRHHSAALKARSPRMLRSICHTSLDSAAAKPRPALSPKRAASKGRSCGQV